MGCSADVLADADQGSSGTAKTKWISRHHSYGNQRASWAIAALLSNRVLNGDYVRRNACKGALPFGVPAVSKVKGLMLPAMVVTNLGCARL